MDSRPLGQETSKSYQYQQKTTLHKTLILQSNCHSSVQYNVQVPYNFATRQIDIGRTLHQIFQQIIPIGHAYQVFYYCRQSEYYVFGGMYPFEDYLYLNQSYAAQPVISIKITRVNPPVQLEVQEVANKKKRISDRSIREILEKVAQWRDISKTKNITLEQSAKLIGLAKKTLDDYLYQIKQGQYYGFNFEYNMNEKVGVLRKFVKQKHKKKAQQPIKILKQFMQNAQEACQLQLSQQEQQLEQQ